ncbi:hypothetical protein IAD21_05333 [Abditibacteriota bacterium]|nr:hypothetical protein IAD21_05333 [Abditibacteriota bacterium]
MFSSRLALVVPRFLWRGRWFWGAWLLLFLLPLTRDEARLHFLGSRYFSEMYGQPWQERWTLDDAAPTPNLSPFERAVWLRVSGRSSYYSTQNNNPATTEAGRMLRDFPREKWLRALAISQSLGWRSLHGQRELIKWARQGEKLDPKNAFFPLILAKVFGDSGRKQERAAALERAAQGTRYDDGTAMLRQVALWAARKAGVSTWSEEWRIWSRSDGDWNTGNNQLDELLNQFNALSQLDLKAARKTRSSARLRSALKRSNELMRVSLLLQDSPCNSEKWRIGAQWAHAAWRLVRSPKQFFSPTEPTAAEFMAFARAQNSAPNVRLAQKCAVRMRLLSPSLQPNTGMPGGAMFSPFEAVWAEANGPIGFGVLGFGFYLLCWWWFISLLSWRAVGQESRRYERVVPATVVIAWTLLVFGLLTVMVMSWVQSPTLARRGPPIGKLEVSAALGLFAFFAPPLLLALWSAVRTLRRHRATLALPARAQLEMNLAPVDAFVLGRATGAFVLSALALAIGLSLWWGFLCWQGIVGYDWLRFMWPGISTRVISNEYTSIDSPATPLYCAATVMPIALIWLISWRYGTDPTRKPIYHDGLRAWKEAIGCALTLTVWVYMVLLLTCHFSGQVFSHRLDVAAQKGEGAFVRGF